MNCIPLVLIGEFPADTGRILELESDNQSFMDLAGAYDSVTAELQDIETSIEPVSPSYIAQLRRQQKEIRSILCALLDA